MHKDSTGHKMESAIGNVAAGSFRVLVTEGQDRHPGSKWAELTVDDLISLDPRATDPERIRTAIAFRHWLVEVLTPLYGQPSRPGTVLVMERILQAAKQTPWEMEMTALAPQIQAIIERNLNTIYRS